MSSKHNLPKLKTVRLLTSDMGSGLQSAVNGVSQGCEDACVNSINGWVSSSSGKQMMTMEHLVCFSGFKMHAYYSMKLQIKRGKFITQDVSM